jgi:hypothetical protein
MTTVKSQPRPFIPRAAALAVALSLALTLALLGSGLIAQADPVPDADEYPRVAFVARNDVPFDSLAVGPVAGALGGIVVITAPTALAPAAEGALVAFNPDVVVIAGGTAAVSQAVENAIDAAGPWQVERKSGANRDETAAELATLLDDYGVGRPALTGAGQVVDDLQLGGNLHSDTLQVEGVALAQGIATFGARVGANGTLNGWFNQTGGAPTVNAAFGGAGEYRITIPGFSIEPGNHVVQVTTDVGTFANATPSAGALNITLKNHEGTNTNNHFNVTVWAASTGG